MWLGFFCWAFKCCLTSGQVRNWFLLRLVSTKLVEIRHNQLLEHKLVAYCSWICLGYLHRKLACRGDNYEINQLGYARLVPDKTTYFSTSQSAVYWHFCHHALSMWLADRRIHVMDIKQLEMCASRRWRMSNITRSWCLTRLALVLYSAFFSHWLHN